MQRKVSVIVLAGGVGQRMNCPLPKQFLFLKGKPVLSYSLELFRELDSVSEIIIACDLDYKSHLPSNEQYTLVQGGKRRQDSVWKALQHIAPDADLVCIHDSSRPLATQSDVMRVIEAGSQYGAAVLAVPVKPTIKEGTHDRFVKRTLDRSVLWEIQTPQVATPELLKAGFALAHKENLTVTDDVSLVELIKHPVKLVEGSYSNIKLTTPEDIPLIEGFLEKAHAQI